MILKVLLAFVFLLALQSEAIAFSSITEHLKYLNLTWNDVSESFPNKNDMFTFNCPNGGPVKVPIVTFKNPSGSDYWVGVLSGYDSSEMVPRENVSRRVPIADPYPVKSLIYYCLNNEISTTKLQTSTTTKLKTTTTTKLQTSKTTNLQTSTTDELQTSTDYILEETSTSVVEESTDGPEIELVETETTTRLTSPSTTTIDSTDATIELTPSETATTQTVAPTKPNASSFSTITTTTDVVYTTFSPLPQNIWEIKICIGSTDAWNIENDNLYLRFTDRNNGKYYLSIDSSQNRNTYLARFHDNCNYLTASTKFADLKNMTIHIEFENEFKPWQLSSVTLNNTGTNKIIEWKCPSSSNCWLMTNNNDLKVTFASTSTLTTTKTITTTTRFVLTSPPPNIWEIKLCVGPNDAWNIENDELYLTFTDRNNSRHRLTVENQNRNNYETRFNDNCNYVSAATKFVDLKDMKVSVEFKNGFKPWQLASATLNNTATNKVIDWKCNLPSNCWLTTDTSVLLATF